MANEDLVVAGRLAEMVERELTDAGLVVLSPDGEHDGVRIQVDEGSVWVRWETSVPLRRAGLAAVRRGAYHGDVRHPAMQHHGTVVGAMNEAITTILTAAGFDAREDIDEYRPMQVLITARRKAPHWRDPIAAPLDGASGFMPGVRVRVLSGDHAGAELVVARTEINRSTREPVKYELHHSDGEGFVHVAAKDVEFASDDAYG